MHQQCLLHPSCSAHRNTGGQRGWAATHATLCFSSLLCPLWSKSQGPSWLVKVPGPPATVQQGVSQSPPRPHQLVSYLTGNLAHWFCAECLHTQHSSVPFSGYPVPRIKNSVRALNLLVTVHKLSSLALSLSHARTRISGTPQLLQTHITFIHHRGHS